MMEWFQKPQLDGQEYEPKMWGSHIKLVESEDDIEEVQLALIGVMDGRGDQGNSECANAPDRIRRKFYQLQCHDPRIELVDLGNIVAGEDINDTYFALATTVSNLFEKDVIPIIIGGSHDLTRGQFKGISSNELKTNLAIIDEKLDMKEESDYPARSFLQNIIGGDDGFLFNMTQIGGQSHFIEAPTISAFDRMNFDMHRLGAIREDITSIEPELRDADVVSVDISAVRQSDAPGYEYASPNGLFGEEICRIMRYAGIADRSKTVGIYGVNPEFDRDEQTIQLAAQMIWYFLDGYAARKMDAPLEEQENYIKYTVDMEDMERGIVFFKSKKSDRWWMELEFFVEGQPQSHLVSCSYGDYQKAMNGDIPERWFRANEKLV